MAMKYAIVVIWLLSALGFVIGQNSLPPSSDPFACSSTKPCKIGCCGKNNVCGLGPDYCAPDKCQSTCDAKSDCDPGWGSQWSARESCPLNVCCSKFGFCGTTTEFCGSKRVQAPSCSGGNSASQRVIGYYEGWSTTRSCKGITPENLSFGAYTHLNYAFAFINPSTFEVSLMQASDEEFMPRLTALKNYNPGLEVWISVGGWSMNDPDQPTHSTFSNLAGDVSAQQKFFSSLLSFMSKYGFDGVDIDWEYPVAPERSGKPADFQNYVSFLTNLRAALGSNGHKYGLTITLPSSYWYMQNFDIKRIEPLVDWFNMMTYDLHGTWDSTNPYIGAVINAHTNLTEIDNTLSLLWRNSIDPAKVVMGIGFYGRSFTLSDPSCAHAGCPFSSGGTPGACSASAGTLMYSEIQEIVANGATVTTDQDAAVKIVTWGGNQWVSYDDETTLKQKMDYANGKCLGGVMVWAASTDDGDGTAITALIGAAGRTAFSKSALSRAPSKDPGQCVWGECGKACPSGLVPVVQSSGNKNPLGIELGCNGGLTRYFCCPSKNPPTCNWKGSPKFCGLLSKNRCSDSEIEVSASTDGCWTGHKSLCCDKTGSDSTLASCKWFGAAPICSATAGFGAVIGIVSPLIGSAFSFSSYGCGDDKSLPIEQTSGKQGEGGQQSCSFNGGFKSYCCSKPSPWTGCSWKTGNVKWKEWESVLAGALNLFISFQTDCKTSCDPGQVTVATDSFACKSGTYSFYCCDNPNGAPNPPAPTEYKLCPGPANLPGLNPNLEDDPDAPNDSNFHVEVQQFDTDCRLPPYVSQPTRRDVIFAARPHMVGAVSYNHTRYDGGIEASQFSSGLQIRDSFGGFSGLEERGLFPRAVRDSPMQLCGPNGQLAQLYPVTYPPHSSVLRNAPRHVFTVGSRGVCAAVGIASLAQPDKFYDYVTEHVFEKQEFRAAIEWMMKGTTPLGNALKAGAVKFQGVFDNAGLFQGRWPTQNFPSVTVARSYGGVVSDTFMGILGRTADAGLNNANYDNLQITDADYNRYKEFIVAGVDFIGQSNWLGYTDHKDRVAILSDVIDTFFYRGSDTTTFPETADVVTSYQATYSALSTLWGDFGRFCAQNGINYDFKSAFQEIVPAALEAQVTASRALFKVYLDQEINWWNSPAAALKYATNPQFVTDMQTRLAGFSTNLNNYISLPIQAMTK